MLSALILLACLAGFAMVLATLGVAFGRLAAGSLRVFIRAFRERRA